jgi:hypothetical protein
MKKSTKSAKIYSEAEIPKEYEFQSRGEGPLKLLTNFEAENSKKQPKSIEEFENENIFMKGTLLSPPGNNLPPIQVSLTNILEISFDVTKELKGIWITTSPNPQDRKKHYYRLMEVNPAYEEHYLQYKIASKIWIFLFPFLIEKENKNVTLNQFLDCCIKNNVCTIDEFRASQSMIKKLIDKQNVKLYAKKLISGFNYKYEEKDGCFVCSSNKPLVYLACQNWDRCHYQICYGCVYERKLNDNNAKDWATLISSSYSCDNCKKIK